MVPLLRQPKRVLEVLALIHLVTVAFVLSPLSFPYSGSLPSPKPQRVYVFNVHRQIFDNHQNLAFSDSGLWFLNMDRNSPSALIHKIPELGNARSVAADCERDLACRLPIYSPRWLELSRHSLWLPTDAPPSVAPNTTLRLRSKQELPSDVIKLEFDVTGPVHLGLVLCPYENVTLERWSLEAEVLKTDMYQDRPFYFIYVGRGSKQVNTPWTFSIDLKAPKDHENNLIDINVMGHYFDLTIDLERELNLESWIPWSHATTWTSVLQTFIF